MTRNGPLLELVTLRVTIDSPGTVPLHLSVTKVFPLAAPSIATPTVLRSVVVPAGNNAHPLFGPG